MGPFVKWAGGKGQLLEFIKARIPSEFDHYYEPFIGSGAVLLNTLPEKASINDVNSQLINVYVQLKEDADAVISELHKMDEIQCDKELYLSMRERYNLKIQSGEMDAECAAMMIWVNKHCFNGLYRVNAKGLFNVPYNNKVSGKSGDDDNLREIGEYLSSKRVTITCMDFEEACKDVKKGDFVYFDSPYVPISITAAFTDYTKDGFHEKDHIRLAELFKRLDTIGVKIMLSNNDVPLVRELYDGYRIETVSVRRAINSDASKRTGTEVIIRNYD